VSLKSYSARVDGVDVGEAASDTDLLLACCPCVFNFGARKTLVMKDAAGLERFTMLRKNIPGWYTLPLLKGLLDVSITFISKLAGHLDVCMCGTSFIVKNCLKGSVKCMTIPCNIQSILEHKKQLQAGNNLVAVNLPVFGPLPKMGAPRDLKGVITVRLARQSCADAAVSREAFSLLYAIPPPRPMNRTDRQRTSCPPPRSRVAACHSSARIWIMQSASTTSKWRGRSGCPLRTPPS
jgi:hypothetical protein